MCLDFYYPKKNYFQSMVRGGVKDALSFANKSYVVEKKRARP